MDDINPARVKISLELSPMLLERFDLACKSEFAEGDMRSMKIRALMREYAETQKV